MKVNNIIHTLAAISAIAGILTGLDTVMCLWPAIALIWIATNYITTASAYKLEKQIEKLNEENGELSHSNIKLHAKLWEADMWLAKANDQLQAKEYATTK
jgi:hypothetical protein